MGKTRNPQEVQSELGQNIFGLGELQYNFEMYEKNKERVKAKIIDLSKELEYSQKHFRDSAIQQSKETLKNEDLNLAQTPEVSADAEMQ